MIGSLSPSSVETWALLTARGRTRPCLPSLWGVFDTNDAWCLWHSDCSRLFCKAGYGCSFNPFNSLVRHIQLSSPRAQMRKVTRRVKGLVRDCVSVQQLVGDLNRGGHFPELGVLPLCVLSRSSHGAVSYLISLIIMTPKRMRQWSLWNPLPSTMAFHWRDKLTAKGRNGLFPISGLEIARLQHRCL